MAEQVVACVAHTHANAHAHIHTDTQHACLVVRSFHTPTPFNPFHPKGPARPEAWLSGMGVPSRRTPSWRTLNACSHNMPPCTAPSMLPPHKKRVLRDLKPGSLVMGTVKKVSPHMAHVKLDGVKSSLLAHMHVSKFSCSFTRKLDVSSAGCGCVPTAGWLCCWRLVCPRCCCLMFRGHPPVCCC